MGIPEHSKCVKCHERIRRNHHYGVWRKIRKRRRQIGELRHKERIREILKVEFLMQRKKLPDFSRYRYYSRYGKYDD